MIIEVKRGQVKADLLAAFPDATKGDKIHIARLAASVEQNPRSAWVYSPRLDAQITVTD